MVDVTVVMPEQSPEKPSKAEVVNLSSKRAFQNANWAWVHSGTLNPIR